MVEVSGSIYEWDQKFEGFAMYNVCVFIRNNINVFYISCLVVPLNALLSLGLGTIVTKIQKQE